MTVLPRFLVAIALLASLTPSVVATNSDQCHPTKEFWYDNQSCCVSNTPPKNPPSPPKSCPTSHTESWYWSNEKSCCLPTSNPPHNNPPPTCQQGHSWNEQESCCSAPPSHPSPPPPPPPPPPSPPKNPGPGDCSNEEFWWEPNSCCLPHGGPPSPPPSPPTGSKCPSQDWYWGQQQKCCIPSHPSPPSPQCPYGWEWNSGVNKCLPIPSPPSPNPPKPSHGTHNYKKRDQKFRAHKLCPADLIACPVTGAFGLSSDYECIDTLHDLGSCGGCVGAGGQDCSAIRGVWNVGCESGTCTVYNCMAGYRLSPNGTACIPL
ncbi:hypothetical protein BC834DRAFT_922157 [Gloeopeniophorella convolvens]|nr:hypothetical protein BC834DRAFT_922157 [Gloeopeniophorella convolvens]